MVSKRGNMYYKVYLISSIFRKGLRNTIWKRHCFRRISIHSKVTWIRRKLNDISIDGICSNMRTNNCCTCDRCKFGFRPSFTVESYSWSFIAFSVKNFVSWNRRMSDICRITLPCWWMSGADAVVFLVEHSLRKPAQQLFLVVRRNIFQFPNDFINVVRVRGGKGRTKRTYKGLYWIEHRSDVAQHYGCESLWSKMEQMLETKEQQSQGSVGAKLTGR